MRSASSSLDDDGSLERIVLSRRPQLAGVEVKTVTQAAHLPRVFHENYKIFCPVAGVSCRIFRGERIWCQPGELMLYCPGDFHVNTHFEPGSAFHVVSIEAHVLEAALYEVTQRKRPRFKSSKLSSLELWRSVRGFAARLHEADGGGVESAFDALTEQIAQHSIGEGTEAPKSTRHEHRALARVRQCLHAELHCAVSLDQLALEARLNKHYLLRVFKNYFGTTPQAYRQALRVSHACSLLRYDKPSAVSAQLGFADISHFRRTFVKYVGMSPSQYRAGIAAPALPHAGVQ